MLKAGEWEAFLAMHPELTGLDFTRAELIRALKRAIKGRRLIDGRRARSLGGASSSCVAWELSPLPSSRLVQRVARELGKLADEGQLIRLRAPSWRASSLFWTIEGQELAPHIAKWYVAETARAR
ncbi:MAG: hypothetical protein H0U46_09690 [Actinobacteria bacterium]|nr:hypothetical protein [Actinomycetota bacterium]